MITYRITTARSPLVTKDDSEAQVEVSQILAYTSDQPMNRKRFVLFKVRGNITEKGLSYPVEWEFESSTEEFKSLHECLDDIDLYVNGSEKIRIEATLPREVFSEVNEWLRIGWVDENGSYFGYVEFKKDSHTLRAKVANMPALRLFGDSVTSNPYG